MQARRKAQFEVAITTGWASERFAREERLSGLAHYLREPDPEADADLAAKTAAAETRRWALARGLTIEPQEPDDPEEPTDE